MDLVVLDGSLGRGAAWTQACPKSLLPLPGGSVLIGALVERFDSSGMKKCIICSHGHKELLMKRLSSAPAEKRQLEFLEDSVPRGTAGCLKACEPNLESDTVMLSGASVWLDDDPSWMVAEHQRQENALTVFCTGDSGRDRRGGPQPLRPAGLFCCRREVFEHIRPSGFQDLKEQLVPALKRAGLRVGAVVLRGGTCEVSNLASYMQIIARILSEGRFHHAPYVRIASDIWCGRRVHIAAHARIVGPALLGHRCRIDDGAVVVGPAVLGDDSQIGRKARLIRVVAPCRLRVRPRLHLTDRVLTAPVTCRQPPASESAATGPSKNGHHPVYRPRSAVFRNLISPGSAAAVMIGSAFIWAFWHSLNHLWHLLRTSVDYSAGQLIPVAALYMVASRRERLKPDWGVWWPGAAIFGCGLLANAAGQSHRNPAFEAFGLIACAIGVAASVLGPRICRRIWFPLLFLFLMIPLPYRVSGMIMEPLQGFGARVAAAMLTSLGVPALRSGNVIEVAGQPIAAAPGSGLRLVLAFLLVTGVFLYVMPRPRWQKVVVVLSSVPVALACNLVWLVLSASRLSLGYGETDLNMVDDGAGLAVVLVAVGVVWLEFWILGNLAMTGWGRTSIIKAVDNRVGQSRAPSGG